MVLYNHRGRGRRGEAFGNMRTFISYYMKKGKAEANVSGTKGKLSEKQKQVARGEEAHNATTTGKSCLSPHDVPYSSA